MADTQDKSGSGYGENKNRSLPSPASFWILMLSLVEQSCEEDKGVWTLHICIAGKTP